MAKSDRPNWGDSSKFEMFSQHRIDLAQEVKNHPPLMEFFNNHSQDEFEVLLAEISSYCGIGLNGDYSPEDLDNLCKILCERLVQLRAHVVFGRVEKKIITE